VSGSHVPDRVEARPALIRLEKVTKSFRAAEILVGTRSLKGALLSRRSRSPGARGSRRREVLRDVTLEVRRGDCLAVLGPNGSGKSTLLRLVAGIYRPDAGRVLVRGRMASMLELGTGFHPDFSGRENVYVNASILGVPRSEIERLYPAILEFSELSESIDAPVRTYSTGMYVRLAFSVAVHVRADVLLIDEVLAVGDHAFREKCLGRIAELRADGTTIVFVSHDVELVRTLGSRAVVIDRGSVNEGESVDEAVAWYLEQGRRPAAPPGEAPERSGEARLAERAVPA
jgi:ABC-type polysaccharide/polyol phosphate transport system ATPase subunit